MNEEAAKREYPRTPERRRERAYMRKARRMIEAGVPPEEAALVLRKRELKAEAIRRSYIEKAREHLQGRTLDKALVVTDTVLTLPTDKQSRQVHRDALAAAPTAIAVMKGLKVLDSECVSVDNSQTQINVMVKTTEGRELIQDILSGVRRVAGHNNDNDQGI